MKRNVPVVALIFLIFFVISFLTNILGPLVPDIISSFSLSLTLAYILGIGFWARPLITNATISLRKKKGEA